MIDLTPEAIAEFFRKSVSFDFKKETISSFVQIQRYPSAFFSLLDRDAFSSLLHDSISRDNQLEDIFMDIFDAGLGIHKLADARSRMMPGSIIAYFLNTPKYQYHQNDVAKIYLAYSAWLIFFGGKKIDPEWKKCPFCGSPVKDGTCTNRACKKTNKIFLSAARELANVLETERGGTQAATPTFWDSIAEGSEFYAEYKAEIEALRKKRDDDKRLGNEVKRKEVIDKAKAELVLIGKEISTESMKEAPDFDAILTKLSKNTTIQEALKLNDRSFESDVADVKKTIDRYRKEYKKKIEDTEMQSTFKKTLDLFMKDAVLLEEEIASGSRSLPEIKALFDETDNAYAQVKKDVSANHFALEKAEADRLEEYKNSLRPSAVDYISKKEYQQKLMKKQTDLMIKVNLLLNLFTGVQAADDKSKELKQKFESEIEKNTEYDVIRLERKSQYDEIVDPIRRKLDELIKEENAVKMQDFVAHTDELMRSIDTASPAKVSAGSYGRQLYDLKENEYYASIRTTGEYVRRVSVIKEMVTVLREAEDIYKQKEKENEEKRIQRKRRAGKAFLTIFILALVLVAAAFFTELAGVSPLRLMLPTATTDIKGKVEDGSVKVTAPLSASKDVVIPETVRLSWHLETYTVKEVSDFAFRNNADVETVELPASIERIGGFAFASCANLRRITLKSLQPPKISYDSFIDSNICFYVPESSYVSYLQDEKWGQLADCIFPDLNGNTMQVSVLFDSNGGEPVAAISGLAINATCEDAPTPVRYGYVFEGWFYTENGEERLFDPTQTVLKESLKLTAKWKIGNYKITYDYAGGTGETLDKIVVFGERYGSLPYTTRYGYTFDGWYIGEEKIDDKTVVNISADTVAVAKWTPNQYVVNFDYQGGEVSIDRKTVVFDAPYGDLPLTSKEGYSFVGWYAEEILLQADTTVSKAYNLRLVAGWAPIRYKIVYQLNEGVYELTESVCVYDQSLTLTTPSRPGYSFGGWSCGTAIYQAGADVLNLTTQADDTILFSAIWSQNENTLLFDKNGGNGEMESSKHLTDESFTLPENAFTREGYRFKGWSTDHTSKTPEILDKATYRMGTASTIILYAVWEAESKKLTLHNVINDEIVDTKTVNAATDEIVSLDGRFVRAGYSIEGWSAEQEGASVCRDSYTMTHQDAVLYSIWTPNLNTLTFDANGGTGEMSSMTIATDASGSLSKNVFTRQGYTFLGWSTTAAGEAVYIDEAPYQMGTEALYTLYAVWSKDVYEIGYVLFGGTNDPLNPVRYSVDSDEILLADPTYAGYTFKGWYEDEGLTKASSGISTGSDGARTFYAKWSANLNTLSFDASGASGTMNAIQVATDAVQKLPKNSYALLGYSFVGWATTAGGEAVYVDEHDYLMGADESYTLYAVWEKDVYTIWYALVGGENSESNPESYSVDSDEIVLADPTRRGYTFVGWFEDEGLTKAKNTIPTGSTQNVAFYAKWSANINTLSFDANGGNGTMDAIQMATDSIRSLPANTFTYEGYSFVGWKKTSDPEEGITYFDETSYRMGTESSYTLYAVWSLTQYSISYVLNGGENSLDNPSGYTVISETIVLSDPARPGYTFGGWYDESTMTGVAVESIVHGSTGNKTFYAKWTANTNELILHQRDDGSGETTTVSMKTDESKALPAIPNSFSRAGYDFLGWKTSSSSTAVASYADGDTYTMGPNATYDLYAVWEAVVYTITYDLHDGTNSGSNPSTYTIESDDITLENPTRSGYTSGGWRNASSAASVSVISKGSTGNVSLEAIWNAIEYTLTYDKNGGSGSMSGEARACGSTTALAQNLFTKDGAKFAGWSTTASGRPAYADQANYTMGAGNVTLYAVWTQTAYVIQYDLDGGVNNTANPDGYNSEGSSITLLDPTKTGYSFSGWYTEKAYTNKITTINPSSARDYKLYAKWTANTYKATFVYDGKSTTQSVTFNSAYGSLPSASKTGYSYNWYDENKMVVTSSTIVKIAKDHTITATYTPIAYTVTFSGTSTTRSIAFGSQYGSLPTVPAKTGYTALGWYYGSTKISSTTTMNVASDHILQPKYTANTYIVTYDYAGGSGSPASKTVTYDSTYGTLPEPTKTGYTFDGWYKGSTKITSSTKVSTASNHQLTAKWTVNTYKITISESNVDVKVVNVDTSSEIASGASVAYGTSLKVSYTTNGGYHDGWWSIDGGNTKKTSTETITMPASNLSITSGATQDSCVARGTMILLANGTEVPVENLRIGDEVLSYDHSTGEYVAAKVVFTYRAYDRSQVLKLTFEDEVELQTVNAHGFFDITLGQYVLISYENIAEFVGHRFLFSAYEGDELILRESTLLSYAYEQRFVERYDLVTEGNLNHIANGVLCCSDELIGFMNLFDFDGLLYDEEEMARDIETYGVFTYEEWEEYVSYEEFVAFNGPLFKIAIAKGHLTETELFALIHYVRTMWIG